MDDSKSATVGKDVSATGGILIEPVARHVSVPRSSSLVRARHELLAMQELRQLAELERQAEFDRLERAKANDYRRNVEWETFRLFEGIIVLAAIAGALIVFL